jgi:hypothetical protein
MSKATQYATNDSKVCQGMIEVSLKQSQVTFQRTITWTKKSIKRLHEWKVVYIFVGLPPWTLKTPMKTQSTSRVIPFQKMIEYQDAISICYGRQATINLSSQMSTNHM